METQAQPLRGTRLKEFLSRPWAARMVATIGAVLIIVGFYTPFAGRDTVMLAATVDRFSATWTFQMTAISVLRMIHSGRVSLTLGLVIYAVYSAFALGGLALIPLLWRPLSPQGATRVRRTFGAWLLLMALLAVVGLLTWRHFLSLPIPDPQPMSETNGPLYIMPGAIIFPLGLLVSGLAVPLLRWAPLAMPPAHRTRLQWASTITHTAGAIVWVIGFYLMPEAVTAACPPVTFSISQFAHGACAGVDSDQALAWARYAGITPMTILLNTPIWHFEILGMIGGITTLGGWMRQLSAQTLAWLAAWPALALGVALVALQGVSILAHSNFRLTYMAGSDWHMAAGMIVTFAGIGLIALGQMGLWREMVRRKRAA